MSSVVTSLLGDQTAWKRVYATDGVFDFDISDQTRPQKWRSSIALFTYRPGELVPHDDDHELVFLRAAVTITGYQPASDEIQGRLDGGQFGTWEESSVDDLLRTYYPCNGAVLQLEVAPNLSRSGNQVSWVETGGASPALVELYPYFLRVSPEHLGPAATNDVPPGTADAYHLGGNRTLFFMRALAQPDDVASGLVSGPRTIDGVHEFVCTMAVPRALDGELCFAARLDTAHLIGIDQLDYEYRSEATALANADAPLPTAKDPTDGEVVTVLGNADRTGRNETPRDYFLLQHWKSAVDDVVYVAADGFEIVSYSDLVNQEDDGVQAAFGTEIGIPPGALDGDTEVGIGLATVLAGSGTVSAPPPQRLASLQITTNGSTVTVADDQRSLTIHAETRSYAWYQEDGRPVPEAEIDFYSPPGYGNPSRYAPQKAFVRRQLRVDLRSTEQTRRTGVINHLLVASTSICTCTETPPDERRTVRDAGGATPTPNSPDLTNKIHDALIRGLSSPVPADAARGLIETDLFARQLHSTLAAGPAGPSVLRQQAAPARSILPGRAAQTIATGLGRTRKTLTNSDVLRYPAERLAQELGSGEPQAVRLKLAALHFAIQDGTAKTRA
jgi:hypothetical protein